MLRVTMLTLDIRSSWSRRYIVTPVADRFSKGSDDTLFSYHEYLVSIYHLHKPFNLESSPPTFWIHRD